MSSWKYAYLFPPAGQRLQPARALGVLRDYSFDPNRRIRQLVRVDNYGHLGEFGDELLLTKPFINDLLCRVEHDEQLFVEWQRLDEETNVLLTFTSSLATRSPNPHICFAWPRDAFNRVSSCIHDECLAMLQAFSKACAAAYVIVGVDLPDDFEDRFVEIDGHRYLDSDVSHRYGHGIEWVWVDQSLEVSVPEGVEPVGDRDKDNQFATFVVRHAHGPD